MVSAGLPFATKKAIAVKVNTVGVQQSVTQHCTLGAASSQ